MTAAVIFKRTKIEISRQRFERSLRNLARWRSSALVAVWSVTNFRSKEIEDGDGRHTNNIKITISRNRSTSLSAQHVLFVLFVFLKIKVYCLKVTLLPAKTEQIGLVNVDWMEERFGVVASTSREFQMEGALTVKWMQVERDQRASDGRPSADRPSDHRSDGVGALV